MSIRYELIEISWCLNFDFEETNTSLVRDSVGEENVPEEMSANVGNNFEYDEDGIPMGKTMAEIREREGIISRAFHLWSEQHSERQVFNESLQEYILIRGKSVAEAIEHSSKSYLSTKAALIFEEVLRNAIPVRRVPIKPCDAKQRGFDYMLIMAYSRMDLGTVKLTVGIRTRKIDDGTVTEKIEYGISVLNPDENLIDYSRLKQKKKKAPHKK